MAARRLDGKAVAKTWRAELETRLAAARERGIRPGVAVVRVGEDPGSASYAQALSRMFEKLDVGFRLEVLDAATPGYAVRSLLEELSVDQGVHGILLQEPVPPPLSAAELVLAIDPVKDLDGVHPLNAGWLFQGRDDGLVPATARGGLELLRREGVELAGKRAVVIGRSNIVGRPFALLLMHEHATVTVCHSRTKQLGQVAAEADILAAAVGKPWFVDRTMVKPEATVLDFGINFVDGQLRGDVDPSVCEVAAAISPTPGGTGSMTNAALLANLLDATERQTR